MKVAVIILNYNSSKDCLKCISYLLKQKRVQLEIIIVDNCSAEAERLILQQYVEQYNDQKKKDQFAIHVIYNISNTGYNAGNNIGLRYAVEKGHQYALIANPDMEFPQEDYIKNLVETISKDGEIVAVGSDIVGPNGEHQNPMAPDGDWRSSFNWISDLLKINKKKTPDWIDNPSQSHYCSKISGCCLFVRLNFLSFIGYFDEYPFLYCEEAIFAKQVENYHKKMYYTVECQAFHNHVSSTKGDPRPRFRNWRRSRLYYIDKYSGYSWFGKQISSFSIRLYISILLLHANLRKCFFYR